MRGSLIKCLLNKSIRSEVGCHCQRGLWRRGLSTLHVEERTVNAACRAGGTVNAACGGGDCQRCLWRENCQRCQWRRGLSTLPVEEGELSKLPVELGELSTLHVEE